MLLKVLFWILVACDLAGIGLFLLLGLAAAGPSKTSPLSVVLLILVLPGAVLLAAAVLFVLARSWIGRAMAFGIAALPLLFLAGTLLVGSATMLLHQRSDGSLAHFWPGGMREVEDAVRRNDAATVATAAKSADVRKLGRDGTNILVLALRQLGKAPGPPDVLRALLEAGADPNAGEFQLPLREAILVSSDVGIEPLRLLLDAGADPNKPDRFGYPAFFLATGIRIPLEVLELLLHRGADPNRKSRDGATALRQAVNSQNWPAVLLLLRRGADWRQTLMLNGMDFRSQLDADARLFSERKGRSDDSKGLAEVLRYLENTEGTEAQ